MPEPWRELGLTDEEYRLIQQLMGREPNYLELALFSVMWSEHCSYKHSKSLLRLFPTTGPHVLQGPGENAGVVDIGDGRAVAFKVESHNHPSAIEPFQGAATGVGGIVRDIFTMGARPIAILDSLRFGPLDAVRNRYLFGGVVSGIGWYGNCLGIPTVGGEVYFEEAYTQNPLVNAMCVGLLRHEDLARGSAAGVGNSVMVVGSRTGRDGIHGATFASEELSEASEARRPSVQVGDPFREKLLIEACLELTGRGLIVGMQDMGAAGLTSSASEMASRAGTGMEMDVALVPRREEGMTPYEVLLSESQERMLVVPRPGCEEEVQAIFRRWGLEAVTVGRVTADGILRILENGEVRAEVPAAALTEHCPVYQPQEEEPAYLRETRAFDPATLPPDNDCQAHLLELLPSPGIADKSWVYRQYDYQVGVNTITGPGSDAAVLRVRGTDKAVAVTMDGNGRYTYLDPYRGGAITVAEAARNLACTGARPLAVTDCLNFGNPEKPQVYWQFHQAVLGMSEACRALETPVVSGNVSFYNETNGEAVYPTPVVGMVGLLEYPDRRPAAGFKREGDLVLLAGETRPELGGSEYLQVIYGRVSGLPPAVNLEEERALVEFLLEASGNGWLASAHDCAEGGLAVTLAECCLLGGLGAELVAEGTLQPREWLFSESQARAVLSVAPEKLADVRRLAEKWGVPLRQLGSVRGSRLAVRGPERQGVLLDVPLQELEEKYRGAIPCLMN